MGVFHTVTEVKATFSNNACSKTKWNDVAVEGPLFCTTIWVLTLTNCETRSIVRDALLTSRSLLILSSTGGSDDITDDDNDDENATINASAKRFSLVAMSMPMYSSGTPTTTTTATATRKNL